MQEMKFKEVDSSDNPTKTDVSNRSYRKSDNICILTHLFNFKIIYIYFFEFVLGY